MRDTYLLTPWSGFLIEKVTGFHLLQKILVCHGNRRFITAFTLVRHLSLSYARSISPCPHIPLPEDPSSYYIPIYA
jgi:hypothetical protein